MVKKIDPARIEAAIRSAEARTSGEIRVSVSRFFVGDVRKVAERTFERLGMTATAERNGVLIFLVPARRKFVVLGDRGIHQKVGETFWRGIADAMSARLAQGQWNEALEQGIAAAGEALAQHFPHRVTRDVNELPDAIDLPGAE